MNEAAIVAAPLALAGVAGVAAVAQEPAAAFVDVAGRRGRLLAVHAARADHDDVHKVGSVVILGRKAVGEAPQI